MKILDWCANHSSPLPIARTRFDNDAVEVVSYYPRGGLPSCRLCLIEQVMGEHDDYWRHHSELPEVGIANIHRYGYIEDGLTAQQQAARDEANATEPTQATSLWLPRVWVNDGRTLLPHLRMQRPASGADVNRLWEGEESGEGFVVWFDCADVARSGPERRAEDTLLAQVLHQGIDA